MKFLQLNINLLIIASVFWLLVPGDVKAQVCDNLALDFDGDDDYISLNTTTTPVTGNSNFTIEMWFNTTAPPSGSCVSTNFRRLFSLFGTSPAPPSLIEVGLCNDELRLYWEDVNIGQPPGGTVFINPPLGPGCHHFALVRNGASINIYIDGSLTPIYSGTLNGALSITQLNVGRGRGVFTFGQDFQGTMDEIRLWGVPRTPIEIKDFKDCTLSTSSGSIPGLVANWILDQTGSGVVAGGNNTIPGLTALDMSGNGNNGTLSPGPTGFLLSGLTSNFVCNPCPQRYDLSISDFPAPLPIGLVSICNGDPAHFCILENGSSVGSIPGATIDWQYSDDNGLTWPFVASSSFTGYCFYVPPGEIDISTDCATSTTGQVNRKYRAKITKTMGTPPLTCTFTTIERDLQICCPVTAAVVLNPQPPIPAGSTLCEGTVTVDVSLTGAPFLPNLSIQWCIDGVHNPIYDNLTFFTYTGPALAPGLCFEAKIQNCSCPMVTVKTCLPVDPIPMCGLITGISSNLMPDDPSLPFNPDHYVICPGDEAVIGMVNQSSFINCNPVWQYHFDVPTGNTLWQDLGSSNPLQNTNTLPQTSGPNPATLLNGSPNPYLWPSGATCIYYRIECRPLSYPNSGCTPCHSNEIRICLMPPPLPDFIIGNTQFCKGGFTQLDLNNPNPVPWPSYTYSWFCNGIGPLNFGPQFIATQDACYWAEISNGCESILTPPHCIDACEVVPIIKCPQDNPCACVGQPITINGCDSYNTCGSTGPLPLIYTWTTSNGGPCIPSGPNGCDCIHTPDHAIGTFYTLTVTDPNLGCTETSMPFFIKPCH